VTIFYFNPQNTGMLVDFKKNFRAEKRSDGIHGVLHEETVRIDGAQSKTTERYK